MKFSFKNFFSKSLLENFTFCTVKSKTYFWWFEWVVWWKLYCEKEYTALIWTFLLKVGEKTLTLQSVMLKNGQIYLKSLAVLHSKIYKVYFPIFKNHEGKDQVDVPEYTVNNYCSKNVERVEI